MAIKKEEFLTWRDHPVSKWAFGALEHASDAQKAGWAAASWDGGKADPDMLLELRTRADAYRALSESTYEDFCSLNGQEPEE